MLLPRLQEARRSLLAGGVALLAHVALFVVGAGAPPPPPVASKLLPADDYAIEVFTPSELAPTPSEENAGRSEETGALTATEPLATSDAVVERPSETRSRSRAETPAAGTSANEPPRSDGSAPSSDAPATPSDSSPPVTLFMPSATALGMSGDGPNPFAVAAGPRVAEPPTSSHRSAAPDAPTAIEAKRAIEQSLRDGVRKHDTGIGLGPEGPVLRALRDAAYAGLAPERGSATFRAVVDAGGIVVDVRLLSSNGNERGWSDARARAMRALGGTKLALRGARGAELVIAVDSDVRLPSGSNPGSPIGTFDVTDISAKPVRVVHARLISLTTL